MKNLITPIIAVALLIVAVTLASNTDANTNSPDILAGSIESLATSEEGAYLNCYCALMSDASCAVNNGGSSKCAGGDNIKCWEYDRNCN